MTTIVDHISCIAPLTDAERRDRWRARAGLLSGSVLLAVHPAGDGRLAAPKPATCAILGLTDAERRDRWRARAGTLSATALA